MTLNIIEQQEKYGSPVDNFASDVDVTTTTAWLQTFDYSNSSNNQNLPYDSVRVTNNDTTNDAKFFINCNPNRFRLVKANSSINIVDEPISRWKMLAVTGTITTGTLQVEAQKKAITQDKKLQESVGINPILKLVKVFGGY